MCRRLYCFDAVVQGPINEKNFRKNPEFGIIFPKFILSYKVKSFIDFYM